MRRLPVQNFPAHDVRHTSWGTGALHSMFYRNAIASGADESHCEVFVAHLAPDREHAAQDLRCTVEECLKVSVKGEGRNGN
jgi:hypothetical protein